MPTSAAAASTGKGACCSSKAWAAPPVSTRCGRSWSKRRRACQSAWETWPTWPIGHEIRRGAVTADGRGRGGARTGLHAHGREQPHRHLGAQGPLEIDRDAPPGQREGSPRLRSHRAGRFRHRDGAQEPVRGRTAGRRRAVRLPGQPAGRADRGPGHPAVDAVRLQRHAAVRDRRQPAEPGGDRLRHWSSTARW